MLDSISSATTTTSTTDTAGSSWGDYDTWLQLLCTTLENQDPLDPADTNEMLSQLTQFSQLEAQMSTNDKLDTLIDSLAGLSSGVGYLGRTVEAEGDTLSVSTAGEPDASWKYSLGENASECTLSIVDENGELVWSGSGEKTAGSHSLAWDGTDSDGNAVDPGDYTLVVSAKDSSGNSISADISILGTVTAIDSSDGDTVLEVGDTQISLDDVVRLAA